MKMNFNATVVIPSDYRDAISFSIEGPLEPYEIEWELSEATPIGSQ